MAETTPELRIVTYMCPSHPVQLYELLLELLEEALNCHTVLQYESRTSGPFQDRPDPFSTDKVDLAFMAAAAYMKLRETQNEFLELLPVTPVFAHQMNIDNKPGYYSDVIVHSDKKYSDVSDSILPVLLNGLTLSLQLLSVDTHVLLSQKNKSSRYKLKPELLREVEKFYGQLYTTTRTPVTNMAKDPRAKLTHSMPIPPIGGLNGLPHMPSPPMGGRISNFDKAHNVNTLLDLRGSTFAYSDDESLSGSKIVLKTLKKKGENASFFGSLLKSGSHLASAQMVLTKQAEWAAVDSTTLLYSKKFMYDGGKDIITLETLGKLPPYPLVVNSRLSDKIKHDITDALLKLPQLPKWKKKFSEFGLIKFDINNDATYDGPSAQVWANPKEKLNIRYY